MRISQLVAQTVNMTRFCLGATRPTAGPVAAHWDITEACNSRCLHCQRWQNRPENELSTEEGKSLIEDLGRLGVGNLSFAGNEPLLRKDLFELVNHAKKVGLVTSLNTNGLILDQRRATSLVSSGLDMLYLSLDGATSETNDYLRGVPGAFEKTLRAIETLKNARGSGGLRIMVNFVVSRLNVGELPAAVDIVSRAGADGMLIQPIHQVDTYFESGDDLGFRQAADVDALKAQVAAVKDHPMLPVSQGYFENFPTFFTNPKSLYRYRCAAAYATVDIRANGDVVPCPIGFATLGNVREASLRDIWFGEEAAAVRKRIKSNQHPICWFACVVPINILLSNVAHLRVGELINPKLIRHILRKVS